MTKKYKLGENHPTENLSRIIALRDFGNVRAGDIGGWIQSEDNLSHNNNCWIYGNAEVCGQAKVYGNAIVSGYASVYGNAEVCGNAIVCGQAKVYGNAIVSGYASVYGNAIVCGQAKVYGNAIVSGNTEVYGGTYTREIKCTEELTSKPSTKKAKTSELQTPKQKRTRAQIILETINRKKL